MARDLLQTSMYDEVPYPSMPFPQSHPDRLATLAALVGLESPWCETARVLELGCAAAGNLLPIAEAFPQWECLGVDLSASQIEMGRQAIDAIGLRNIRLEAMNLLDLNESMGEFDFILCHGVYSWAPSEVQAMIFTLVQRHLTPRGLAYINYNTLPGWHFLGLVRDLLRWYAGTDNAPDERVRRARSGIAHFLRAGVSERSTLGQVLKSELEPLQQYTDPFLFHAYLNVVNRPLYFHEFLDRCAEHQLHYVGDTDWMVHGCEHMNASLQQYWVQAEPNWERRQQVFDYLYRRSSRQSIVGRIPVDRRGERSEAHLRSLRFTAQVSVESSARGVTTFRNRTGNTVSTSNAGLQKALMQLSESYPESLSYAEAFGSPQTATAEAPATDIYNCIAAGIVEPSCLPSRCTRTVGPRPHVTKLARYQAAKGLPVTNLRHQGMMLGAQERRVLELLDGSRDRSALAAEGERRGFGTIDWSKCLAQLALLGFLVSAAPS